METAEAPSSALGRALRTPYPREQMRLREPLRQAGDYMAALRTLYVHNPFFRLTETEAEALTGGAGREPMAGLIAARHRAVSASAPRYVVFCMPKSGSSFLKSALAHALDLPVVSLTCFGNIQLSSMFGMNGREQEMDELALVRAGLVTPQGFVAQHHTRYTPYLGLQMEAFGLRPLVTQRNILDALVSFDDMMLQGRPAHAPTAWVVDTPFAIPAGYASLEPAARYRIIGASLGVWLVQFHLSWLRAQRQGQVRPLVVRYEEDILDPARLTARLGDAFGLDEAQRARLFDFARHPDPARARLNVGRPGRGRERIPTDVRDALVAYAGAFGDEIPPADVAYLLD
jgi:hypothetical protein